MVPVVRGFPGGRALAALTGLLMLGATWRAAHPRVRARRGRERPQSEDRPLLPRLPAAVRRSASRRRVVAGARPRPGLRRARPDQRLALCARRGNGRRSHPPPARGAPVRLGTRLHRARHGCGARQAELAQSAVPAPARKRQLPRRYLGSLIRLDGKRLVPVTAVGDIAGDVDRPALADDRHLHLAGVLEVILDLPRDLVREQNGAVVVDLARVNDPPDLAARLERIDLVDAGLLRGELLQGFQALDVVLEALAARPWA